MLTSDHHLQASGFRLSSKDPPTEMKDRGNLHGDYHHYRQRLLASVISNDDKSSGLDIISRLQDAPHPPTIHQQGLRTGTVFTWKMTILEKRLFVKCQKLFLMMIMTSAHHIQASGCPLSSKDLPTEMEEMEDSGSPYREHDNSTMNNESNIQIWIYFSLYQNYIGLCICHSSNFGWIVKP